MTATERLRAWATSRHFAQLGIVALLLATIRIPAEYLRLGGAIAAEKMMIATIISAGFCLLSSLLHFFHRDWISVAVTIVAVATLIVYKFWQLPQLA